MSAIRFFKDELITACCFMKLIIPIKRKSFNVLLDLGGKER